MGVGVLFLLMLVSAGGWLHSRWAALRDAQAARREAEALFVFAARPNGTTRPAPLAKTPAPASDFYPTLPGNG
jgi:hypothetical protein